MNPRSLSFLFFLAALLSIASEIPTRSSQNGSPEAPLSPALSDQNLTTKGSSANSTEKPAKKVWTNDDLRGLRNDVANSTLVEHSAEPAKSPQKHVYPKSRNAKWYHDQIAKLQARIPALDSQVAQLQSAIDGKPTGNGNTSQRPRGVKADNWSVELRQFEAERDDVMSKISVLQDEARHNGISQSALP